MGLVIVTGASRGIGRAIARQLAARSWTVLALARDRSQLEALAHDSASIVPVVADLSQPDRLRDALEPALREHGPCDVLVNNAGYALRGAIEEIALNAWRREFEVNLFACAQLIQRVVPSMRDRRQGRIVNVSSVAGRVSTPFNGAYSATKFALEAMNDALRVELRPFGIHVIALQPGPVATDFRRAAEEASGPRFDDDASPYIRGYRSLRAKMARSRQSAWSVDKVAGLAVEAIEAANPRPVYAAYGPSMALGIKLRALTPSVLDRLVARRAGWSRNPTR
jgi:short-subunit dehydrogenase